MAEQQELFKVEVCIYKKDEVSYEDLIQFATKDYPPRAMPLMEKYGVVKFISSVKPPQFREPFRKTLQDFQRPEWTVPEYDLVQTFYLRSLDDMGPLMADPKWHKLEEEAQKLSNMRIGHIVVGHDVVLLDKTQGAGKS
ncbi:hypothetical protein F4778DRAFT_787455 [Xylariomycetidae sp. FL2044]|nr:hypothetical protein F4778DRAFT_787455 [Xylariomycetidae sp. FL2044]